MDQLQVLAPSGGFTAALLFGAVVVWFHAWNQFNRPTYRMSPEFAWLIERLRPSEMRKGGVYVQAFIFYAVILTAVYLGLCLFLSVPFFQQLGVTIPGLEFASGDAGAAILPEQSAGRIAGVAFDERGQVLSQLTPPRGPNPSLPLAVSLAVVGLAPNVPILVRVEEWIRTKAHKLSGIPTQLIEAGERLRDRRLLLSKDFRTPDGLLISETDWRRIDHYFTEAEFRIPSRDDFRNHVSKIIAFREWIFRGGVAYPDGGTRGQYEGLEREIRTEIRTLLRELDGLTGFDPAGSGGTALPDPLRWSALAREANILCGKVCVLLALYSERRAFGLADERRKLVEALEGTDRQKDAADHRHLTSRMDALDRIDEALADITIESNRENFSTVLYFRIVFSIVAVATVFGAMTAPGAERTIGSASFWIRITEFVATALITYGLTLFIALGYQQEAMKNRTWENIFSQNRSRAIPQYITLFVTLWLCALIGLIGYAVYSAIASSSFEIVSERFEKVLFFAFKSEFYRSMMGALLATCVLIIVDAWRDRRLGPLGSFWPVALIAFTTLAMAIIGGYAENAALVVTSSSDSPAPGPATIFWAAVRYGTIGFVTSFFSVLVISEEFVVREQRNENYRYVVRRNRLGAWLKKRRNASAPTASVGLFLAVAATGLVLWTWAHAEEPGEAVLIGMREDAMPFVWRERAARETYRGFLYDMCTDATTRAGYHFEFVDVSAEERGAIIMGELGRGRHENLDLLCDPTTISLERLDHLAENRPDMVFSPIVFVANGSYVERGAASKRTLCRYPVEEEAAADPGSGGTEADLAAEEDRLEPCGLPFVEATCFGRASDAVDGGSVILLAGHVGGTTARNAARSAVRSGVLRLQPEERLCLYERPSHTEGVGEFCRNEFDYYFGDVDIIEANIRQVVDAAGDPCDYQRGAALSYEPYALLITSDDVTFRAKFIAALYEIFSDGTAAGRFSHHFGDYGKSRALEILFRINGIPGMRIAP